MTCVPAATKAERRTAAPAHESDCGDILTYQRNTMEQYNVTGMSQAACFARVEKACKGTGCDQQPGELADQLHGRRGHRIQRGDHSGRAGSRVTVPALVLPASSQRRPDALVDHDAQAQAAGLIARWAFCRYSMYFSMGHMMWGWPLPTGLTATMLPWALSSCCLGGHRDGDQPEVLHQWLQGAKSRLPQHGHAGGHGLMASFVWSTYALFA